MASTTPKKKRISYVLPLRSDSDGHRLGINSLAFDDRHSILYSAGRDGVICAWNIEQKTEAYSQAPRSDGEAQSAQARSTSTYRQHVQAHTHWINDICLVAGQSALATASSDLSVKFWRPDADNVSTVHTLGLHSDYVKRVACPHAQSNWVAAGGLDHKVSLWDLSGAGQRLQLDAADREAPEKGSVYALACNTNLIATGGPESVVKLWDPRSGDLITKFVGHTDNIRDVLISRDNDTVMTASSDKTVKTWSLRAGRCIQTMGMHKDSVWCLMSNDPGLSVFYSGDRSGFVVKTDTRGLGNIDNGLSIAVAQEQEGINKITLGQSSIWTATASSSINSWQDADLSVGVDIPDNLKQNRPHAASRTRGSVAPQLNSQESPSGTPSKRLPFNCVLRISNMTGYPGMRLGAPAARMSVFSSNATRKASIIPAVPEVGLFSPLRSLPADTIEGQDGLIKHVVLSDKQRVLTLDTTGEVVLWDLLKCAPIENFGKQELEKVAAKIDEQTSIARWCSVDTRTGTLSCTIDEHRGFDAEVYADDTEYAKEIEFREDQRINLGRWILRYLFSAFLDEELRRDEDFRSRLSKPSDGSLRGAGHRSKPQMTIDIPSAAVDPWLVANGKYGNTPRAMPGTRNDLMTPGLAIGLATPGVYSATSAPSSATTDMTPRKSRSSTDGNSSDYFTQSQPPSNIATRPSTSSSSDSRQLKTPSESSEEKTLTSPTDTAKTPGTPGRFGKLLSKVNKGKKATPRSQPDDSAGTETSRDKASTSSDAQTGEGGTKDTETPTSFEGYLRQVRAVYTAAINKANEGTQLASIITQALPTDLPVLRPPRDTTVIIQEERSETGGAADLFEARIEDLGRNADTIEAVAPPWLAEVLLKNRSPIQSQDNGKLKFILEPVDNLLPWICKPDRTEHLNANRMLRARKMAAYAAEKLEPPDPIAEPDPTALRPEAYIDLYCNGQLLEPKTTLAWMRSHIWRGASTELIIQYKANGRKNIVPHGKELIYIGPALLQREKDLRGGVQAAAQLPSLHPSTGAKDLGKPS